MYRLIYASSPRIPPHAEILDIVRASERNNSRLGCSGVLFFSTSEYLQVIEGPEDSVAKLMETIRADERHAVRWEESTQIARPRLSRSLPMGYLAPGELAGPQASALLRPHPGPEDGLAENLLSVAVAKYPSASLPVA
jgi:hypothetical protein